MRDVKAGPQLLELVRGANPTLASPPDAFARDEVKRSLDGYLHTYALVAPSTAQGWQGILLVADACDEPGLPERLRQLLIASATQGVDSESLEAIVHGLVPAATVENGRLTIPALEYLAASGSFPRPLALRNLEIASGRVVLTELQARLLVRHHLASRLPLPSRPLPDWVATTYQDVIADVRRVLSERRRRATAALQKGRRPECFPPCIQHYLAKLQQKSPVNHHERFNLVAFLHAAGSTDAEIIALFREQPGFDEATTAYQVRHITSKPAQGFVGYRTMGCQQMRDLDICPDHACPGPTPTKRYVALLAAAPSAAQGAKA